MTHNSLRITELADGWQFRENPAADLSPTLKLPWQPATVPGHVHADLVRAGVIEDPFYRMSERGVQWVDEADWQYACDFELDHDPAPHTLLHCAGVDTVAEIFLNDTSVGTVDNMFIEHEFAVGHLLKKGANRVQFDFRSAKRVGRERLQAWESEASNTQCPPDWDRWSPRSFVRKSQYMYGWDWGPELASCGIWRPVKLIEVPVARLLDFAYDVTFDDTGKASVAFDCYVERAPHAADDPLELTLEITRAGNEAFALEVPLPTPVTVSVPSGSGRLKATATVSIEDPQLWWPNRHNPTGQGLHPTLYTVEMSLSGKADERVTKIGLRTIELVRDPDENGGNLFKFRVNGQDIFAKGANWIPADSFPSRVENEAGRIDSISEDSQGDDRVYNLLWMACDAGYNMLRVWGGGLYESEHFYELCDEHGILVWQDFGYGCAYYPDSDKYLDIAQQEAMAAVRRIRCHASLAIWCGNNENNWMYESNWGGNRPNRHIGERLYHEALPAVIAAEDPKTPYWPSSPFGDDECNSGESGDTHDWGVWHGIGDWVEYAKNTSRFVSEFGFASSCGISSWNGCLNDDDRTPASPVVQWHDKTRKGYETYLGYVRTHYPEMETLEDLIYYSQLNQADALKFGVEHYRRLKGHCWGTLFWQLNDCWPVQSWAVIDSTLQPKAAFYASRQFYAPLLVSFAAVSTSAGNTLSFDLHITNDTLGPVQGSLTVQLRTFTGNVLSETVFDIAMHCNSSEIIGRVDNSACAGHETYTYLVAVLRDASGVEVARNLQRLAEPKDFALPDPGLNVVIDVGPDEDTLAVTVASTAFAASVWLYVDTADGEDTPEFSDNFFNLEAGETRTITVTTTDEIVTAEDLRQLLRLRTLHGEIDV